MGTHFHLAPKTSRVACWGNDLDSSAGPSPQQVRVQLVEFANKLVVVGISHVVICQLIRPDSWLHFSPEVRAIREVCVNDFFVKAGCEGYEQVSFWKHKRFYYII